MEMPKIKVADFEGPFDLLLHLIKKHEMDIYNIEIYKITNQYLKYLEEMKEMDLEITSEFIVVAATLIEIKSKKLLPKVVIKEENEEDVEKDLMTKLIEYKKFKGVSRFFKDRYISSGDVYTKMPELIQEEEEKIKTEDLLKNVTLLDLYKLYNELLENYRLKQNRENVIQKKIFVDRYKLEDKMQYVLDKLNSVKVFEFNDFIKESECKMETVVTFLALLELIKLRMIKVFQDNSFGNILIKRRNNE
ncbi:segregation/condensation protein A [Clostridium chauvoei]|uniref:Segregation and condensation protein A n=2 Tax=Clostridium chauvoei TaxID=46867 RepID=S6ERK7_9CLOT|nr:segregation/condensation protein A [Clostridium chauvoei]ATD55168.1 segregation/condensation protein A [Clostridium chauvoei]MBX7279508.1 segregation/condensation protein A [Clostridium chauvoei]MBX7281877.1 segregation/condensation protein A [Clostridium chauvoei]MBX7284534.1 segregation/condensation protein A [Clostridium chauvoei]MBX7286921.1 segregation/condensation protein A [Clostridium chauvoei]